MINSSVILRTPSGISGDMLVTGLAKLAGLAGESLEQVIKNIGLPGLINVVDIKEEKRNGIAGWRAHVNLKKEHHHRTFSDIRNIIDNSAMSALAKKVSLDAFYRLAQAEASVHMVQVDDVTFHEVGALDSILDICLATSIYDILSPEAFYCSPLPVCDGFVSCEHGMLSTPAPAVLELLKDVPVYGLDSSGETVTPTAIALLKAFNAQFGLWPGVVIEKSFRVYGGRSVPNVVNGAIFTSGRLFDHHDE